MPKEYDPTEEDDDEDDETEDDDEDETGWVDDSMLDTTSTDEPA